MKVDDATILGLASEMRQQGQPVNGLALRAALKDRFGARCGTARIYRLLQPLSVGASEPPTREPAGISSSVQDEVGPLRAENEALRQRAELAEAREELHQNRWARQVAELREQLRPGMRPTGGVSNEAYLHVHRQLRDARMEIEELKAQVRAAAAASATLDGFRDENDIPT